ncbi:MAG: Na(+)-translocating NADH-quinone reductase subunit C [Calditrichia bacterium]
MSAESTKKMLVVVLGVCIVCSILVSAAAVSLKPRQEANKKHEKLKNILLAGDLLKEDSDVEKIYNENIRPVLINIETGEVVPESEIDPELNPREYDLKSVASNPKYSTEIPSGKDIAGIRTRPKFLPVYEVISNGEIESLILPIYGKGLWSTMYGFIALDKDLRTIKGFTFYEHGETPGLGGEVDNPKWKAQWKNKMAYDENGNVLIEVIKGKVDPSSPAANHQIDGLSGSTLTTRGVHNLVRFWLGEMGYSSLIKRLKEERTHG